MYQYNVLACTKILTLQLLLIIQPSRVWYHIAFLQKQMETKIHQNPDHHFNILCNVSNVIGFACVSECLSFLLIPAIAFLNNIPLFTFP